MKNCSIITFTTDFGDEFALSQLQAIVLSANLEAKLITISNKVTPFSILEGSFIISQAHQFFPMNSIHVGVVDPGVGSERDGIIIKSGYNWFVGPNNGLFYSSVIGQKFALYKINENIINPHHSATFHGRDIFAKTAALISLGQSVKDFATSLDRVKLAKIEYQPNQILHIDDYGNYKINNDCQDFEVGDQIEISTKSKNILAPFVRTFADSDPGEIIAYKGSHNLLEIAQNFGSASNLLKFSVSEILSIQKY